MLTKACIERFLPFLPFLPLRRRRVETFYLHERTGEIDVLHKGIIYTIPLEDYGKTWELYERLGKFLRASSRKKDASSTSA